MGFMINFYGQNIRLLWAMFGVLPMVKYANLPMVLLVPFLPVYTNGNQKTLNIFLLPVVPLVTMVPLVDHMVEFL